jgi:hypothetical protein
MPLLVSACRFGASPNAGENPIIIETRTDQIHLDEFEFYVTQSYPEALDVLDGEMYSYFFDKFRRDLLIVEISRLLGFRITEEQVEDFIKNRLTGVTFSLLTPEQRTLWRGEIERRLAIRQFLRREILKGPEITDADVARYYDERSEFFQKEPLYRVRFCQISTKEAAEELRKALKKSREPFATVAANFSDNEGFRLPISFRLSEMPAPFREALGKLKPGRASNVISVNRGESEFYYVVYLESVTSPVQISYDDAYHYIAGELHARQSRKRFQNTLKKFVDRLPLKVYYQNLPFDYVAPSQRKEV